MSDVGAPAPLDEDLARLLAAAAEKNLPSLTSLTASAARARVEAGNALCAGGPVLASVEEVAIPLSDRSVRVRVYRPDAPVGTMVYLHGGGWVTGSLNYSDELCRSLAVEARCTVVSVEYRLAPEHPFPQPLDDAWAALLWAARELAGTGPLAIGGDSAGGNLAAVCALRAGEAGGPALALQLLLYPVLDGACDTESYRRAAVPLGAAEMHWFWDHYIADASSRLQPDASPLRHPALALAPPTLLVVAGHDPLRDEGRAYAAALRQAGVELDVLDFPALCHGFARFTGAVPAARAAVSRVNVAAAELLDAARARLGQAARQ